MPLHVFEPRYRQLTTDLVTGAVPGRTFAVVAVRPGWNTEDGVAEAVHDIGCTAELKDSQRRPDGRFDIIARGMRRFRLLGIDPTTAPYLTATIEPLPDLYETAVSAGQAARVLPGLAQAARGAHRRYCTLAWQPDDWKDPSGELDPAMLAHALAGDCLLTLEDRQTLLEQRCPAKRLRMVRSVVARETEILRALGAVPVSADQLTGQQSRN
jgi:Uncharacterized protein, similar to the N-terminal domain of Lon protease